MSFLEKIKQPIFWTNFAKVAIPFFIIVTLISLLINSSSEIFSGDFETLNKNNFAEGKWKNFFGFKIVFSTIYGLYITNKNMK
ncbi:hypothetical protein [Polaribacter aquimarinus]|uniref:Uncharacterized protein n=1 Tax=Polaribacter aquimarinus TaxID=2100726 RepID=A0A2U2JEV4_9FLAO|nr:hypothetical protein [Polaribacter aquimarinus]PWG06877.1 hypothetical protein DIS07_03290 [Polaribacter aquimarinus]